MPEFNNNDLTVLNYLEAARLKNLSSLKKHWEGDEVFIPVSGEMQLINEHGREFALISLTPREGIYRKKEYIYIMD